MSTIRLERLENPNTSDGGIDIDSSGKVGIGTASPVSLLEVENSTGSAAINITASNTGYSELYFRDQASSEGAISFDHNNDVLNFYTGGSTRATIDSSGNLGIGTASPSQKLTVKGTQFFEATNSTNGWQQYTYTDNTLRFNYNGSGNDEITITSAGNVLIGTTTTQSASTYYDDLVIKNDGASTGAGITLLANASTGFAGLVLADSTDAVNGGAIKYSNASNYLWFETVGTERIRITSAGHTQQYYYFQHYNNSYSSTNYKYTGLDQYGAYVIYNQANTGVYLTANATSWSSNSDERLKTDLVPIEDGLAKVNSLRAVTGRYLSDEVGVSRSFLIAQDVQQVLPEAVDATNPESLGVSYTDVIPLLVAALKDAKASIETLEAKVAALESTT